jgi:hypothetical protein
MANGKGKDIPDDDPELEQVWEKLDQLSGDELRRNYAEFAKKYPQQMLGGKPADEIDLKPPRIPAMEVPEEGRVKEWGAAKDPRTWKVVEMKNKGSKGETLYKVVDDKDVNVADLFTSIANAGYFIKYYIETHAVPTDHPGTKPDVPDEADEGVEEETPPEPATPGDYDFPIPEGFEVIGPFSTAFKHWGRHETNYASGGAGPSERWDNIELPDIVDLVAGYEFIIGPEHGKRGSDNVDMKTHADGHNDKNGGWYIAYLEWEEDGKTPGAAGVGKEYPHPSTSHLAYNVEGKDNKTQNFLDGKKHGFLMAKFLDAEGVPTIMQWYNEAGDGKIENYKYMGKSKDAGNMKPGPVCTKIGQKGVKKQSLQIRMDEVPGARIMNAFACEVKPPEDA